MIWRWTKRHQFRIIGERSWKLRTKKSSEMMAFGESNWKDSWNAPDGYEKNSHNRKTIMRGWHKLELWIFGRTGKDLRGTLLRSAKSENDEENTTQLLRHSGTKKNRNDEPTMKIFWKRSWRRYMTDENSFLRQTSKRIWEWLQEN